MVALVCKPRTWETETVVSWGLLLCASTLICGSSGTERLFPKTGEWYLRNDIRGWPLAPSYMLPLRHAIVQHCAQRLKHSILQESSLNRKVNNSKVTSGRSWNLQDLLSPSLSELAVKAESFVQTEGSRAAKTLLPDQLPGRSRNSRAARRGLGHWGTRKGQSLICWAACRLCSMLQIFSLVRCLTYPGVGLGDTAVFGSSLLL